MSNWLKIDEIEDTGSDSESQMRALIRCFSEAGREMDLLESGATHAIHLHQAVELGALDSAATDWQESAITIVDINGIQTGYLKSLLDTLGYSAKSSYLGVLEDSEPEFEEQLSAAGSAESLLLKFLGSLSIDAKHDNKLRIRIFAVEPQEPTQAPPSLRNQFGKRQIMETGDNLSGRERWFKKRNE